MVAKSKETKLQTFTIYSKPACTYCDQAKALLESKGIQYDVVNLDVGQPKSPDSKYISRDDLLAMIPTARTMPQIFAHVDSADQYVGGYLELKSRLGL